jgi:beta-lactam-binding protein with PASTA domain
VRCAFGTIARAHSRKVKKGRVVSQSRRPGARLPRGTRVNLVVSRGAQALIQDTPVRGR